MVNVNVEHHGSGYCIATYKIDEQGRSLFLGKDKDELGNVIVYATREEADEARDFILGGGE